MRFVVVAGFDVFVQVQDLLQRRDLFVAQRGAARCHGDCSGQLLTALIAVVFFGVGARHGRFGGAETRFQGRIRVGKRFPDTRQQDSQ